MNPVKFCVMFQKPIIIVLLDTDYSCPQKKISRLCIQVCLSVCSYLETCPLDLGYIFTRCGLPVARSFSKISKMVWILTMNPQLFTILAIPVSKVLCILWQAGKLLLYVCSWPGFIGGTAFGLCFAIHSIETTTGSLIRT